MCTKYVRGTFLQPTHSPEEYHSRCAHSYLSSKLWHELDAPPGQRVCVGSTEDFCLMEKTLFTQCVLPSTGYPPETVTPAGNCSAAELKEFVIPGVASPTTHFRICRFIFP